MQLLIALRSSALDLTVVSASIYTTDVGSVIRGKSFVYIITMAGCNTNVVNGYYLILRSCCEPKLDGCVTLRIIHNSAYSLPSPRLR